MYIHKLQHSYSISSLCILLHRNSLARIKCLIQEGGIQQYTASTTDIDMHQCTYSHTVVRLQSRDIALFLLYQLVECQKQATKQVCIKVKFCVLLCLKLALATTLQDYNILQRIFDWTNFSQHAKNRVISITMQMLLGK